MIAELAPPSRQTLIEVVYPAHRGVIGLRGSHAPLSWTHTEPPAIREGDRLLFSLSVPNGEVIELKLVRNDEDWAAGRNYAVHAGDHLRLEPYFDRGNGALEPPEVLEGEGETLGVQVLLPPSYAEQENKRYPVLYTLDGQALWSISQDPFGIWHLDTTFHQLYELNAVEEVLVVGIDTSERRIDRLSPVADAKHRGGGGERFLRTITEYLVPHINRRYRTKPEREHTGIMGSSMGGLFAFTAAWTRSDVFGKAACLSSSFWWANRHAVRLVQRDGCPEPRPLIYIDSGAAMSALEQDANLRDGFHHTRAMFRALAVHGYAPGVNLHRLVFAGASHDPASWSARVAIPLQLLFPPELTVPHCG